MKTFHVIVITLVLIGALNWGLIGLFDFNLVSALFGVDSALSNIVYVLVGLSALAVMFTEYALYRQEHHPVRTSPRSAV